MKNKEKTEKSISNELKDAFTAGSENVLTEKYLNEEETQAFFKELQKKANLNDKLEPVKGLKITVKKGGVDNHSHKAVVNVDDTGFVTGETSRDGTATSHTHKIATNLNDLATNQPSIGASHVHKLNLKV